MNRPVMPADDHLDFADLRKDLSAGRLDLLEHEVKQLKSVGLVSLILVSVAIGGLVGSTFVWSEPRLDHGEERAGADHPSLSLQKPQGSSHSGIPAEGEGGPILGSTKNPSLQIFEHLAEREGIAIAIKGRVKNVAIRDAFIFPRIVFLDGSGTFIEIVPALIDPHPLPIGEIGTFRALARPDSRFRTYIIQYNSEVLAFGLVPAE